MGPSRLPSRSRPTHPRMRACRWGGEECGRQRAMPHVKSYLRYRSAGDGQAAEVAWLLVGSHNLSKAGELGRAGNCLLHLVKRP